MEFIQLFHSKVTLTYPEILRFHQDLVPCKTALTTKKNQVQNTEQNKISQPIHSTLTLRLC